ncbi:MAG: beta-ribofuranosylaminobenzene 5'-phosphate synthase family protein [Gemmatimonadota bacterium]
MTPPALVSIRAPARLHFGVLDLRGHLGRRFGGIGAAIPKPGVELEAERADSVTATGPDADRAREYAERYLSACGIRGGARIKVVAAIPPHTGLGSGTQLGLAVARALAELYQQPTEIQQLSRVVGRGRRSAIGTWSFAQGGFILEGGRRPGTDAVAPLLARLPIPEAWRCVVVVPEGQPGLSGEAEAAAFSMLPPPSQREVERVAHIVLLQLLPALADGDLDTFGPALSEIQRITGNWFAPAQGGAFAPGASARLVDQLADWGAVGGVGQSSWGPAVYGIVGSQEAGESLAAKARQAVGPGGAVFSSPFDNQGARILVDGRSRMAH